VATLAQLGPAQNDALPAIAGQVVQEVSLRLPGDVLGHFAAHYPVVCVLQVVDGHTQVKELAAALGGRFGVGCAVEGVAEGDLVEFEQPFFVEAGAVAEAGHALTCRQLRAITVRTRFFLCAILVMGSVRCDTEKNVSAHIITRENLRTKKIINDLDT